VEVKGRGNQVGYKGRDLKGQERVQCIPKVADLSYEDLCIHSNLDLPKGFKVPKFDVFRGIGNPLALLRAYCD